MTRLLKRLLAIGPGAMVAAAFIGPGTVMMALRSGGTYGTTLLWGVAFSTLACIVLQEMTARLGVCGKVGLGEAIRNKIKTPWLFALAAALVISAILVGNAAYESGNIGGGGLGATVIFPSLKSYSVNPASVVLAVLAFGFLITNRYKLIERFLVALVCVMGVTFVWIAISVRPSAQAIFEGLTQFHVPDDGVLFVVGLIGTTVVPYNLFLHATASKERWVNDDADALTDARIDTVLSITLGGIITAAILIAASSVFQGFEGKLNYETFGQQLESRLGWMARYNLGLGLMAAGLSSSITAPLAAAYATTEILDLGEANKKKLFKAVWLVVLLLGTLCIFFGYKPATIIVFAQVTNGILLPIIAIFLLWVINDRAIVGEHHNRIVANVLGIAVVVITMALGARSIWLQILPWLETAP